MNYVVTMSPNNGDSLVWPRG